MNPHRVPLGPVLLMQFIGTMGFSIAEPFLVFLVTRLGGKAIDAINPIFLGTIRNDPVTGETTPATASPQP